MGSKCKDKKKSSGGEKNQSNLKVRCKEKPVSPTCRCPPISTSSFPYKEFPPPAPPDGRSDLWDLQFCRWWGWNWVRKRESAIESSYKSDEQRKSSLSSKCRTIEEEQCPPKNECLTEQMPPPKSKKSCFPSKGHESKAARQKQLTPKEQFKVMCKCLLGKKNAPCGMAKLYNTPSASVMAFTQQKRISYGVCDKSVEETPEKSIRKSKGDNSEELRCKAKSWSEAKPTTESTTPCSRQSMTENSEDARCESLYSHRNESSTEDSTEYLTVRLQHITSDSACPCQKHPCAASKTKEQVVDERNQTEPITIICPKETKETQTCPAAEKKKVPRIDECLCSEKLIKLKGKKHKTICIMVCCCSACKQNNASIPSKNYSDESYLSQCGGCEKQETGCSCKKCPKLCWKKDKNSIAKPERDTDKGRFSSRNFETIDELTTLPLAVSPVNAKKLSKFGTPSKNYPWMQSTESAGTTVSLNNIANRTNTSAISDIYEWLNPDFDDKNPTQTSKFPDLIGITEDLSYLKKLDSSKKSNAEDRILLDAVCDAILQEHEDKTCQFLDEFQLSMNNDVNRNYRELGIVCNLKSNHNLKTDVYTELSRALVNQEDVGIQLSTAKNLNDPLKQSDVNKIDTMMNSIMNNIFSEPKDNNVNTYSSESKNETKFGSEIGNCVGSTSSPTGGQQSRFNFVKRDRGFTRTGLMPYQASTMFRKTTKRGAPALESGERECKKKMKQEDSKWKNKLDVEQNDRIGHIFSKIDDIVQKSKVKTAEIQKVLSFVPKKQEICKTSENILKTHNLSQNEEELTLENNKKNTDNSIASDFSKNTSKRNYPMSSDTFKGIICEEVAKQFDYLNMRRSFNYVNDEAPADGDDSKSAFEGRECTEEYEVYSIIERDGKETACEEDANKDNFETINKKISKLSVHNFIVCDEKSKSEAKSPIASTSSLPQGQQLLKKRDYCKTSLIPVRKRSSTD